MPRLPFLRGFRAAGLVPLIVITLLTGFIARPAAAAAPIPRIVALTTRGQAPFAVHAHALTSTLNAGDESTARFEWTFGDPAGAFNSLVGWNAAHIYDAPGTYTVTLKVINQNRETASVSVQVIVDPASRSGIYVSPSGNDSASGSSSSTPIRTLSRARTLLGSSSNKAVYLQRGATFTGSDSLSISGTNVLVSAYGSGAAPIIRYDSPTWYTQIIQVNGSARDVVIENIEFDSPFAVDNRIVRGVAANGRNVTVRNCRFGDLSYALNTEGGGAVGLLTQGNVCGNLGAYFVWGEGTDHTHLGNVVGGSEEEHNIRFAGVSRALIHGNDLTNVGKSSIWCMLGDHAYISGNSLRSGRLIAGPNFDDTDTTPSERFRWVVAERNEMLDAHVVLYDGAENITIRSNVMHTDGLQSFSIWGWAPTRSRTARDIAIVHNTVINNSSAEGLFASIGEGAVNVSLLNNIYAAPQLNGHSGGNVCAHDVSLSGHSSRCNIWSNPRVGPYWHSLNGSALNPTTWMALPETTGDIHRTFTANDLDTSYLPTFTAAIASPVAGVFADFSGNPLPATGLVNAGAAQSASGSTFDPGDINHDGLVNTDDLLMLLGSWGTCKSCAADINADGAVNTDDLLTVLGDWG